MGHHQQEQDQRYKLGLKASKAFKNIGANSTHTFTYVVCLLYVCGLSAMSASVVWSVLRDFNDV